MINLAFQAFKPKHGKIVMMIEKYRTVVPTHLGSHTDSPGLKPGTKVTAYFFPFPSETAAYT